VIIIRSPITQQYRPLTTMQFLICALFAFTLLPGFGLAGKKGDTIIVSGGDGGGSGGGGGGGNNISKCSLP